MVWAGISHNLKTELVILDGTLTGQRYIDQVINPQGFMQRNGGRFTFMDDNERPHPVRFMGNRLQQAGIQ